MNEINKTIISASLKVATNKEIEEIFERMPYLDMLRIYAILHARIEHGQWSDTGDNK